MADGSAWRDAYNKALNETHNGREAKTAMFKRCVEIADSPDVCDERIQIENALDDLSAVKALSLT
jgi:hypothetical protein